MLTDVSNNALVAPSRSPASAASKPGPNKRTLASYSSEGDAALPHKLKMNRTITASTSSSSSPAPSSPFFPSTHLDAYNAPSSPLRSSSLKLPTSPINCLSSLPSLPPSSPSFALSSSATLNELASKAVEALEQPPSAQPSAPIDTPRILHLERNTVFYFGRKAKKAIPQPLSPSSRVSDTFVPVLLPKSAKNASRLHCSARILPAEEEDKVMLEVRVTGMNGMKVDGKLLRKGSIAHWTVKPGRRMTLNFWGGWACCLIVAESEVSLLSDGEGNGSDQESEAHKYRVRSESPISSGAFSPPRRKCASRAHSPALSAFSDDDSPFRSSAASSRLSAGAARARGLVNSLDLDLSGLIASAIVFHPRATVALDEVVRALLRETGSLWKVLSEDEAEVEQRKEMQEGEDEAVEAWRDIIEEVLSEQEMFGMIDNSGLKDAAGRPIPPNFYYIPDADPSPARVAALEPFVKRVRGARAKGGVRYFWAKPSLKKNR
ncbi:hypothetical protein JCM11641_003898 [Rhodosporidiobolus odoratus]